MFSTPDSTRHPDRELVPAVHHTQEGRPTQETGSFGEPTTFLGLPALAAALHTPGLILTPHLPLQRKTPAPPAAAGTSQDTTLDTSTGSYVFHPDPPRRVSTLSYMPCPGFMFVYTSGWRLLRLLPYIAAAADWNSAHTTAAGDPGSPAHRFWGRGG